MRRDHLTRLALGGEPGDPGSVGFDGRKPTISSPYRLPRPPVHLVGSLTVGVRSPSTVKELKLSATEILLDSGERSDGCNRSPAGLPEALLSNGEGEAPGHRMRRASRAQRVVVTRRAFHGAFGRVDAAASAQKESNMSFFRRMSNGCRRAGDAAHASRSCVLAAILSVRSSSGGWCDGRCCRCGS